MTRQNDNLVIIYQTKPTGRLGRQINFTFIVTDDILQLIRETCILDLSRSKMMQITVLNVQYSNVINTLKLFV